MCKLDLISVLTLGLIRVVTLHLISVYLISGLWVYVRLTCYVRCFNDPEQCVCIGTDQCLCTLSLISVQLV